MIAGLTADPVLMRAAEAGLSVILLVGGVQKLFDLRRFELAVAAYALLPDRLLPLLVWLVPLLECLAGGLVLAGATRAMGALLGALLIAGATVPVVVNLLRGHIDIACGCSGRRHAPLSWGVPLRNAFLLGLALLAGASETRPIEWLDYASVTAAALGLLVLYHTTNELLANQASVSSLRKAIR